MAGADEVLTFSLGTVVSGLPALYSGGTLLTYSITDNTLTATAGPNTIFTFTVFTDGSWAFDLDGQLDHAAGDGENFELRTGDGTAKMQAIDLSSIIKARDADGDEVFANTGAFQIEVQDDIPGVGNPQDSVLANEVGNSLTADLDLQGSGADDPQTISFKFVEGEAVTSISGVQLTSNSEALFWYKNSDLSWSAVTKDGDDLDPDSKSFTITIDDSGSGSYTVVQNGVLDGASSTKTIDFSDALNGGNTFEAVFGSGGTSTTDPATEITVYENGVFVWARASHDLADPFGGPDDPTDAINSWTTSPETVNYSNEGVGVGSGAMIDGSGNPDSARTSDILSIKFFSSLVVDNSGSGQEDVKVSENSSTALNLTAVTLVIDHLGSAEAGYYTLWNDGVQVTSENSFTGLDNGTGSSADNKDDPVAINIGTETILGSYTGDLVFDEIRLEAGTDGSNAFRIESAEITVFQEGVDETILVPLEVTDADGDSVDTDFTVTFDGDNNIDAVVADGADSDDSENGMVISGSSESDTITGTDYDDTIFADNRILPTAVMIL
jgi:T1SS-143 domain-containing protein